MSRDILDRDAPAADWRIAYGSKPKQFCDLRVPALQIERPVAIIIHGGFWRARFALTYMGHLCESLRQAGIATWNVEYRGVGDPGGGWPGTLEDITAGAAKLASVADQHALNLSNMVALGHSAGGQLALWLASKIPVRACFSLGGVVDLTRACELNLGDGAAAAFLGGGPDSVPERFAAADPIALLPLGTKVRLFHGRDDSTVPLEISEGYAAQAGRKGDDALVVPLAGGHFELVDPATAEWEAVRDEISRIVMSSSSSAV
jgi:pimeloyl-ACP methyl ester carboxylesterase